MSCQIDALGAVPDVEANESDARPSPAGPHHAQLVKRGAAAGEKVLDDGAAAPHHIAQVELVEVGLHEGGAAKEGIRNVRNRSPRGSSQVLPQSLAKLAEVAHEALRVAAMDIGRRHLEQKCEPRRAHLWWDWQQRRNSLQFERIGRQHHGREPARSDVIVDRRHERLAATDEQLVLGWRPHEATEVRLETGRCDRRKRHGQRRCGRNGRGQQQLRQLQADVAQAIECCGIPGFCEVLDRSREIIGKTRQRRCAADRMPRSRVDRDGRLPAGGRHACRTAICHETISRLGSGNTSLPPPALNAASRLITASRKCHGSTRK